MLKQYCWVVSDFFFFFLSDMPFISSEKYRLILQLCRYEVLLFLRMDDVHPNHWICILNHGMLFHFHMRPPFFSDSSVINTFFFFFFFLFYFIFYYFSPADLHSAPADPHSVPISSRECPERSTQPVRAGGKRRTGLSTTECPVIRCNVTIQTKTPSVLIMIMLEMIQLLILRGYSAHTNTETHSSQHWTLWMYFSVYRLNFGQVWSIHLL